MNSNSQTRHVSNTAENAKRVQNISAKIFFQKYNPDRSSQDLQNLIKVTKTMNNIVRDTENAIKGAKLVESRAKTRLAAIKKASSDTIKYTAKAKRATITSKKAKRAASITSKKIKHENEDSKNCKIHREFK